MAQESLLKRTGNSISCKELFSAMVKLLQKADLAFGRYYANIEGAMQFTYLNVLHYKDEGKTLEDLQLLIKEFADKVKRFKNKQHNCLYIVYGTFHEISMDKRIRTLDDYIEFLEDCLSMAKIARMKWNEMLLDTEEVDVDEWRKLVYSIL